jgi:hypothetical protein
LRFFQFSEIPGCNSKKKKEEENEDGDKDDKKERSRTRTITRRKNWVPVFVSNK